MPLLEDMEVQVCAFCFKENPPGEDKDTFQWIECEKCQRWVHEVCDYVTDKANYICCMCAALEHFQRNSFVGVLYKYFISDLIQNL